jgi:hypothetical protein
MNRRYASGLLPIVLCCAVGASADDQKTPHISKQTRMDLVRTFNAELVYIRAPFPMGKIGLTLKDGNLSPSGDELQNKLAMWGPAAKPGDQAARLVRRPGLQELRARPESTGAEGFAPSRI